MPRAVRARPIRYAVPPKKDWGVRQVGGLAAWTRIPAAWTPRGHGQSATSPMRSNGYRAWMYRPIPSPPSPATTKRSPGSDSSIVDLAASPHPVLLIGERGTGKGQLMRAIHRELTGNVRPGTMHLFSLAATPTELADSELFGHEMGAFTGAVSERLGAFRTAARVWCGAFSGRHRGVSEAGSGEAPVCTRRRDHPPCWFGHIRVHRAWRVAQAQDLCLGATRGAGQPKARPHRSPLVLSAAHSAATEPGSGCAPACRFGAQRMFGWHRGPPALHRWGAGTVAWRTLARERAGAHRPGESSVRCVPRTARVGSRRGFRRAPR